MPVGCDKSLLHILVNAAVVWIGPADMSADGAPEPSLIGGLVEEIVVAAGIAPQDGVVLLRRQCQRRTARPSTDTFCRQPDHVLDIGGRSGSWAACAAIVFQKPATSWANLR